MPQPSPPNWTSTVSINAFSMSNVKGILDQDGGKGLGAALSRPSSEPGFPCSSHPLPTALPPRPAIKRDYGSKQSQCERSFSV